MYFVYKQLLKQIFSNRVLVVLMAFLTVLTSLSFFFCKFSIDGNQGRIAEIAAVGGDSVRYQVALQSNTILAYNFFAAMVALTAFVFFIFFYRFFRSGRKQMGCLKALGFKDTDLMGVFVGFTAVFALLGGGVGCVLAYPMSNILIRANMEAYGVAGLARSLGVGSLLLGILGQTVVLTLASCLCYGFVWGKEPGVLLAGNQVAAVSWALRVAGAVTEMLPVKNKSALRIALRKPLAVVLILGAVMGFSTCAIIGRSLNISSQIVFESQTIGHEYGYDVVYPGFVEGGVMGDAVIDGDVVDDSFMEGGAMARDPLRYLSSAGTVAFDERLLEYTIFGLYGQNGLFRLIDKQGSAIALPDSGSVVIGTGLADIYGMQVGDMVFVTAEGGTDMALRIAAVAFNAKSNAVYVCPDDLAASLDRARGTYNGVYSDGLLGSAEDQGHGIYNGVYSGMLPEHTEGIRIATREQRLGLLKRDAVSNQVSGVINQVTGVLVGGILFFLSLYINFQDNAHDILILHMMGYRVKAIRKMLINVYLPLVWFCFAITLPASIWLVWRIQRNLSIATGDYMPFSTNLFVIAVAFAALTALCQLVQWTFGVAIKRMVRREDNTGYTDTL